MKYTDCPICGCGMESEEWEAGWYCGECEIGFNEFVGVLSNCETGEEYPMGEER